ncbi:MAG: methylated-DNA--[protein]-cysteine S-methyltransferase [Campylobacterota bacterium]|nr:methylated-DNA--[protein]-cysteine S-methyltransferase [Campylobacterota bacterium]
MKQINIQYYKTKLGTIIMGSYGNKLCLFDFRDKEKRKSIDNRLKRYLKADFVEQDNNLLKITRKQFDEYIEGRREEFDIPLLMLGTEFQKNVWRALLNIPYGTTKSYANIAEVIGNKKAVRAVANANGANAIGIIIPCHRIIGSDGTLTGYAGGLDLKDKLLKLEQK